MKKAKANWIGQQCSETEGNLRKNNSRRAYLLVKDWATVKQGKATIVQASSGRCITEEREILNRWTKHSTELYNHEANGDPSVTNCPQTDTEDDHPILRREVVAAVQSWKKGKSAGVDNIPAKTRPSRWRGCNHRSHDSLRQDLADRRIANPMDPVFSHHTSQERQPAAVPALLNNLPHWPPKQSHSENHTEHIEATSAEDHR